MNYPPASPGAILVKINPEDLLLRIYTWPVKTMDNGQQRERVITVELADQKEDSQNLLMRG